MKNWNFDPKSQLCHSFLANFILLTCSLRLTITHLTVMLNIIACRFQ